MTAIGGMVAAPAADNGSASNQLVRRLEYLHSLHSQDLITEEEHQAKREAILDRL